MAKPTLEEIAKRVKRLPELPAAALRISRLLDKEDTNAEMLAEVIRMDASLTGQILRLCNSAAYGFTRKISTVKEAVAVLGFATLRSMVYTIIAKFSLDKPIPGYGLKEGDLWLNSLTCAVYAKHLAKKFKHPNPELPYTAALLRDIGMLVLGEYVGANYAEIEKLTLKDRIDFVQAEGQVLGSNHCMVGARVAEQWNLPPVLINAIKHHHKPTKLPAHTPPDEFKLVTIVHVADMMTRMVGYGSGSDGLMYNMDAQALTQIGIDPSSAYMEEIISELVELGPIIRDLVDSMNPPKSQ
jgi:putative nucleotidyltransferase with HDIG domain